MVSFKSIAQQLLTKILQGALVLPEMSMSKDMRFRAIQDEIRQQVEFGYKRFCETPLLCGH